MNLRTMKLLLGVLFILIGQNLFAAPNLINYQGVLTDSGGVPVTNPTQAMTFKLYDSDVEGNLVWAESRTVDVQNGQYNLKLGEVTTLHPSIFDGGNLWLQVTVGGEVLGDLQQLTTVPYAYFADTADYANFAYYVDGIVSGDGSGLTDVAADWSLLVNVPADFADGVDNTATSLDGLTGGAITGSVAIGTTIDPDYLLTIQADTVPIGASVESINTSSPESAGLVGRAIGAGGNYHYGLRGEASNAALTNYGLYGQAKFQSVPSAYNYGAFGTATGANRNAGVGGEAIDTNSERNYGLSGIASGGTYNFGVYGYAPVATNSWAGYFDGDVNVAGKISGDGSGLTNLDFSGPITVNDSTPGPVITGDGGGLVVSGTGPVAINNSGNISFEPGVAGAIPATGAGSRMMWYPEMSAFRVGFVTGDKWDDASIGAYSLASGYETLAFGMGATAMGSGSQATGTVSTAMGSGADASGDVSTAIGYYPVSSGERATAIGSSAKALGNMSVALGYGTQAKGVSATAIGHNTIADGWYSTAMGESTTAPSYRETALGSFNTIYTPAGDSWWDSSDRLLVVGNGMLDSARSDAMTILKNGDTTINGSLTAHSFVGDGSGLTNLDMDLSRPLSVTDATPGPVFTGDGGGLVVSGTGPIDNAGSFLPGVVGALPTSGAGTRMMWYPEMAAFRVGEVTGTQWDEVNIGAFSWASGFNTRAFGMGTTAMGSGSQATGIVATAIGSGADASGDYATAIGNNPIARGENATAIGSGTKAYGNSSVALGYGTYASEISSMAFGHNTKAWGPYSTAFGQNTLADGFNTTAMGESTTAPSYRETALGSFNTSYTPAGIASWHLTDRLLVVGNGQNDVSKSDALVILKNGNTTIHGNKVSVHGDDSMLVLNNTGTPTVSQVEFQQAGAYRGSIGFSNAENHLFIYKSGNVVFKSANGGGVTMGVNTSTPDLNYKLYVAGNAYTTGTWGGSDERWKKNIYSLEDALDKVSLLRGVSYDWRVDEFPDKGFSDEPQIGVIAQEVEQVLPELVHTDSEGYKSVAYDKLTAVLIEAVKELRGENEGLKALVCSDHPAAAICL